MRVAWGLLLACLIFIEVVFMAFGKEDQEDPFLDDDEIDAKVGAKVNGSRKKSGSGKKAGKEKGEKEEDWEDDPFADLEEVDEEDEKLNMEVEKERKEFRDGFGDIDALADFVHGKGNKAHYEWGQEGEKNKIKVAGDGADAMRTQMGQLKEEQACPKECRTWVTKGKHIRCDLCHLLVGNLFLYIDDRMEEDQLYTEVKKMCDDEKLCNKYEITDRVDGVKWALREEAELRSAQDEDREGDTIKWQSNAMRVVCKSALKTYEEEIVDAILQGRKSKKGKNDVILGICRDIKACKKKERSELENVEIEKTRMPEDEEEDGEL
eukprot:gnl/MRDRNA2_/MRDRNA2_89147_c0_seq1.p1 gnl/MRDRNA2_/MRDRNA2_89147_c0~~gnl/MRDRNA2_/MRDRNA2_89147_c0_seq1.p1  ORF type:complete len:322 (-),score=119.75 gnl/MRDRNA2_/MRDRNA2_89147_c0_seq1:136-1101(-)